ncbi:hypothetical protein OQA88_6185 [Cercophora sp. LCS_1]
MTSSTESPVAFLTKNPVFAGLSDVYDVFQERRSKLGLSNPGTVDNVAREVQRDVLCTNHMFTGLRAEISKVSNFNPLFQVSHQFAVGERMQPYTLSGMYGSNKLFAQGNVDNSGSVSGRLNWRWGSTAHITKMQFQSGTDGADGMNFEHEYTGADFTSSLKTVSASILDGGVTGMVIGDHLQSLTPNLALGFQALYQRQAMNQPPQTAVSYVARYKGQDWVASAQLQAMGGLQTSFWKRLSDRVQAGVDMTLSMAPAGGGLMGGPLQKEGLTTFGAKYDFRMSTFRAQLDTQGKLTCILEKRVGAPIQMTFAAEVDHATQQAKIGLGISLEASSEELQMQQEALGAAPQGPNIPF